MMACLVVIITTMDYAGARTIISYTGIARGAIIVKTSQRSLYWGLGNGRAVKYPVGVGRANRQWTGHKRISAKRIKPAWSPTAQILRDKPGMVRVIAAGSSRATFDHIANLVIHCRGRR